LHFFFYKLGKILEKDKKRIYSTVLKRKLGQSENFKFGFFIFEKKLFLSYGIVESSSSYIFFKRIMSEIIDEGNKIQKVLFN
jgi:hypothetical protein